jgi:hypothetical protein
MRVAKSSVVRVLLEIGIRRTFASAIDWPGWCRSGKTPELALAELENYSQRYATAIKGTKHSLPKPPYDFDVVETVQGNATTDFGAPGVVAEIQDRTDS